MRRTIAAIVMTAVVGVAAVAGPATTSSGAPAPVEQITCGTLGDPACALIDELEAVLAPLAPVLALTAPLLGELGTALHSLGALAEQLPDRPADEALEAVRGVLAQLGKVTKPVLGLLGVGQLDALTGVLTQLEAALVEQLARPAAAATPVPTAVTAAAPGGTVAAAPSLSSGRPSTPVAGTDRSSTVPSVPVGDELALGPLDLPALRGASSLLVAPQRPVAAPEADVLPFERVVADEDDRSAAPAVAATALLSGLLLALGLTLRARERVVSTSS